MPLLDDIKSVLSFEAFRPEPDDADTAWKNRFTGRRTLLMNVNRTHTSWRTINKKGGLQETGSAEGDFVDVAHHSADAWRSNTDGGWVAVSVNNRFIISLETNLSRRENFAEMLRVNAKSVLGAKYDRGKRYALYHHPESAESLLMACDDSMVKSTEESLRANGLKAGRICCGLFAMIESKLREIYTLGGPESKGSFLLITCCEGSIAALTQQDGQWTDMRCRSGVGADNPEAMIQIISPMVQKLTPGTPVLFQHDGIDGRFAATLMQQLQQIGCRDITVTDQLWQVLSQN